MSKPSWDNEQKRLEQMLRNNGFQKVRMNGSHAIWRRGSDVITLNTKKCQTLLVWNLIRKFKLKWEDVW